MKNQQTIKLIRLTVDAAMTVLLLFLMAYQVTGEVLHEWIGIGMIVLLIIHHAVNRRWYSGLLKGRYNGYRIISTLINTALLVSIALTALCGMSMSGHAVPFLYGMFPVSFARRFHLAMSYWSFCLMGIHLGLHIPAMLAKIKLKEKTGQLFAGLFALTALCGLVLLVKNGIPGYLFFQTPFAFLDYETPGVAVLLENLAELTCFACVGYAAAKWLQRRR